MAAALDNESSSGSFSDDDDVPVTPRLALSMVTNNAPDYHDEAGAHHRNIKCSFNIAGVGDGPWVQDLSDGNTVFNIQKNIYEHVKHNHPAVALGDMSKINIKHGDKSWLDSLPLSLNDLVGKDVSEISLHVELPSQ